MSKTLASSEYIFHKNLDTGDEVSLVAYIDYPNKKYDIMQHSQEGILPRLNNRDVKKNLAYAELLTEALHFVNEQLFQ